MTWYSADTRQPGIALAERRGPRKLGTSVDARQHRGELLLQDFCFVIELRIASGFVGKFGIFTAADNPSIVGRPDIEVRL
jgi:hypothetical protein